MFGGKHLPIVENRCIGLWNGRRILPEETRGVEDKHEGPLKKHQDIWIVISILASQDKMESMVGWEYGSHQAFAS